MYSSVNVTRYPFSPPLVLGMPSEPSLTALFPSPKSDGGRVFDYLMAKLLGVHGGRI